MSDFVKPELSSKNQYHLNRHRYYELKHFCLQYPFWKKQLNDLAYIPGGIKPFVGNKYAVQNPTATLAEKRAILSENIRIVESAAKLTDPFLAPYILKHVTEGGTYETINAQMHIPCNREYYYRLYRRFFWILDSLNLHLL